LTRYAIAYAAALLAMGVGDYLWLGVLMPEQYKAWIGPLMLEQPRLGPAAAFYFLYPVGLIVFAVAPALERASAARALIASAFFGFVAYGTYDLSNLATLKAWPVALTVVDMLWGAFLSACAGWAAYGAARAWQRRQ
jgi:uncharacterized membrane protein